MQKLLSLNHENSSSRDWPIVLTASIGLFLSTLDTGIINVALPTLDQSFHVSVHTLSWAITLYLLLLSTTIVLFGRISDRFGLVKVYSLGLLVFGMASIMCGWSMSVIQLIVFRGIQGIGAAMLQATSSAIITTTIPEERRGAALGALGMMLGLGPILGPSLGGILLTFVGWQWIFWINVPICVFGIWSCRYIPILENTLRHRTKLDVVGNILLGFTIFGFLFGLSETPNTGTWPQIRGLSFFISATTLIGFLIWEYRANDSIIQVSLFRQPRFYVPLFSVAVLGLSTAVVFIIPPYDLELVSKLPPWQVGLVNLAAPLGLVLLSRVSGMHIKRYGKTRLMIWGLFSMLSSLVLLYAMEWNGNTSLLFCLVLLYGVGAGVFVPANLSAIMEITSLDTQGTIGAVQRMVQNIGIAVGTSVSATFIDTHSKYGISGLLTSFREALGFAGVLVLVSFLATLCLSIRWSRLRV